jgi:hypothetical protein
LGSSVSGGECINFSTTFSGKEQQLGKVMVIITVICNAHCRQSDQGQTRHYIFFSPFWWRYKAVRTAAVKHNSAFIWCEILLQLVLAHVKKPMSGQFWSHDVPQTMAHVQRL